MVAFFETRHKSFYLETATKSSPAPGAERTRRPQCRVQRLVAGLLDLVHLLLNHKSSFSHIHKCIICFLL